MKTLDVYQVTTNSDLTEWRWRTVVVANFSKRKVAEIVKTWKWPMGTDGNVEEAKIQIFDTLEEYQDLTWDFPREEIERIKKSALRKLSNREKKILWL